ncbi:MAG: hypothetical protein DMG65_04475 [Candidatus Angelobacter sp. Gp1-AA117]|nr:MAG: hypothetical protein DMG65_04475 [Candidatus Angelobacter sp. Gp1-AA117]
MILGLSFFGLALYRLFKKLRGRNLDKPPRIPHTTKSVHPIRSQYGFPVPPKGTASSIATRLRELKYEPLSDPSKSSPLDREKIAEVVPYPLPSDYLQFLEEFPVTGAFPCMVDVYGIQPGPGAPDAIYPEPGLFAAPSGASEGLLEINKKLVNGDAPEITPDMLAIGDDAFGNLYLLKMGEPGGQIYFWDHEQGGLSLVANSFTDFISRMQPSDEQ